MVDSPDPDGRDKTDIRAQLLSRAPYYVPSWDPEERGVGVGLVDLFAEMSADLTERLDAAPNKHRAAFIDELGFDAKPPQPARAPLQVEVNDNAPRNVQVRPGTEALAETNDEIVFRIDEEAGFEATAANLTDVIAVDPDADAVFDHSNVIGGGEGSLFDDENVQEHVWYIGDEELLAIGAETTVTMVIKSDVDPAVLTGDLQWEYYGEAPRDGDGDETEEGWHEMGRLSLNEGEGNDSVEVRVSPNGPLVECEVDGVESKWLRVRLPPEHTPNGRHSFRIESVGLGPTPGPLFPDAMLANDVPQPRRPDEGGENDDTRSPVRPFGKTPRQGDTFYFASSEAFSKTGSEVTISFGEDGSVPAQGSRHRSGADNVGSDSDGDPVSASEAVETVGRRPADDPSKTDAGWLLPGDRNVTATEDDAEGGDDGGREEKREHKTKGNGGDGGSSGDGGGSGDNGGDDVTAANDNGRDRPTLSWEYWNGNGWARLRDLSDGTRGLLEDGAVTFTVPADFVPTKTAGHEGLWIRTRLVGGDYGTVIYAEETDGEWTRTVETDPPTYENVSVTYGFAGMESPDHLVSHNARSYDHVQEVSEDAFRPFRALPETSQTLYLGFDQSVTGGPIQLLVDVADQAFPPWFAPQVRWERRVDGDGDVWERVPTRDGTEGLIERGIVGLSLAEPPAASERFGTERHWVRARVRGTMFQAAEANERAPPDEDGDTNSDGDQPHGPRPCGTTVGAASTAGEPTTSSPTVLGIYPNVGWTAHAETIDGEMLGGSDGGRDQTFEADDPPVLDSAVWVDEVRALSTAQREALKADRPDDVVSDTSADGDMRAFWVRWERVDAFVDSSGDDRHYVLDPTDGRITFGDGTRGKIPPRGTDNVRIEYSTGGGEAGNVSAGAIEGLKRSLPFVESVTNPVGAVGGAPAEATEDVLGRAPRAIRDRDRAVTPADFERLAAESSRLIARARCLPGMDERGDNAPGWITVLIVPSSAAAAPEPETGLLNVVEDTLSAHAPASLLAREQLVVRGPSYVGVGVDARIVVTPESSLGIVEDRVVDRTEAFLHPLTGGFEGDGWPFGKLPSRSDIYAMLEQVDGVDYVDSLVLSFEGESEVAQTEGDLPPTTDPDALIFGAAHELTVAHDTGGER